MHVTFAEMFFTSLFKITATVAVVVVVQNFPDHTRCVEPSVRHATADGTFSVCTVPSEETP